MKHISFILRKIAFTFASALIFIFFSCAAFDSDKTTSLTLSFNGSQFFSSDRSASREAVTSDYNLVISLSGDSTETKVISGLNKSGSYSVTFDNVKVGNTLYVRTDLYNTSAYIYDRENQTYPHIFTGTSSPLTVKSGKNTVSLKMKDMTKGDSKWSYRVISEISQEENSVYYFYAYSNGKYQVIRSDKSEEEPITLTNYLLSEGTWRGDENTNTLYLTECSYYNSGSEKSAFVSFPEEKSYKLVESGDGYSFTFTGASGFSKEFTEVSLTGDEGEEAGWSVIYDYSSLKKAYLRLFYMTESGSLARFTDSLATYQFEGEYVSVDEAREELTGTAKNYIDSTCADLLGNYFALNDGDPTVTISGKNIYFDYYYHQDWMFSDIYFIGTGKDSSNNSVTGYFFLKFEADSETHAYEILYSETVNPSEYASFTALQEALEADTNAKTFSSGTYRLTSAQYDGVMIETTYMQALGGEPITEGSYENEISVDENDSFSFTSTGGITVDFELYDKGSAVSETTETTVTAINYTFEFYYADSKDGEYTLQSSRTVTGTADASEAEEITGRDLSDYLKNWLLAMSEGYEENSSMTSTSQSVSGTTLVYNRKEYYYKAFSSYLLNAASESGYNFFAYGGSSGGYTTVPYFVTDSEGIVVSYGSCDLDYSATNPDNLETISIFEYNYLDADSETYKSVEDSTKYTGISVTSGTTFTFSGSGNTTINGKSFTISG